MVKFQHGAIVVTRTAAERIPEMVMAAALLRHLNGDWGDVSEADRAVNDRAVRDGDKLLSAYHAPDQMHFWIITEADRFATTALPPCDY